MQVRILTLIICILFTILSPPTWAADSYVGEDLGNDIYKRLDEGTYKLKKQIIESRLKGNTELINKQVGEICSKKEGETIKSILCFREGVDFTPFELDGISAGDIGPIYTHIDPNNVGMDVEKAMRIRGIITEYYKKLQTEVNDEQKKLQSVGSIGLFTDGNKDNSSYDLMVDLQNIHNVIFARDIAYNGTDNMGASSVANLLANVYPHPFLPLDSLILSPKKDPGVTLIPPTSGTGLTLSGVLSDCPKCTTFSQAPGNLDPNFLLDVQSQLLVGINSNSSLAFSDDAKLPENWAKTAQLNGTGSSSGLAGGGSDTFPCSGKDFFCILVSMTDYTQNILGGKASTIEKILDENLKIANQFAPSSFVQSKMTKMFFGLSLTDLNLPGMLHAGVVLSYLPPPILNLKTETAEEEEFNKILVGTFEELGLDFKRQNSLEKNDESRMVHNLPHLSTDSVSEKSDMSTAPVKSSYIQAKEMDLKKGYGDSFNDDLFELHDFTLAFSKSIANVSNVINAMHAIPQK